MRRILGIALLLVVTLLSGCSDESKELTGKQQAERDITSGKFILRELPLPSPPGASEYSALLKQQGITFEIIQKMTDEDREYNKSMLAAIEKKYGKGILSQLKAKANANWQAKVEESRQALAKDAQREDEASESKD